MLPRAVVRGRKNPLHFGLPRRLKKARDAAGLSFDSVAQLAGMTDGSSVAHLERKAGHVPRLDTVAKVAAALGMSPAFLAYGLDAAPVKAGAETTIGMRLRTVRQERGLTMRALARLAGLTDTAVRSTESGTSVPTVATVEAFAHALAVSPAWLAFGVEPQELPARRRPRATGLSSARA